MLSLSPVDSSFFILCSYINRTDQIQILRIANIEQWYFEKVIFPQQRLLFDAPPEAELEIHTNESEESAMTLVRCKELSVK